VDEANTWNALAEKVVTESSVDQWRRNELEIGGGYTSVIVVV